MELLEIALVISHNSLWEHGEIKTEVGKLQVFSSVESVILINKYFNDGIDFSLSLSLSLEKLPTESLKHFPQKMKVYFILRKLTHN
jgi:hypothetical protein